MILQVLYVAEEFLQDARSNASLIEAEGLNDYLDVKISPLFSILRNVSNATGGPAPRYPVPYYHWAIPNF